jgi:thioredoxin-dependent peroxiredoxin
MTGSLGFNQTLKKGFNRFINYLYRLITIISIVGCLGLNLSETPAYALGGILPSLNQPAPAFTLPTNTGAKVISLAAQKGKWVVVYFYPKDFTSGCTLEARRFQEDLPKYLAINTQILGISADSVDSHAEFCDSEGLKFPLLADEDGAVSKVYGSWVGFLSMRHTFIIDPDGILRAEFTKVSPSIHSRQVLTKLKELQQSA